ncbi:MAG: hypothetical protein LBV34_08790 [Nocardiopsaceae bacterium]|jgi:hypothetical protein|nr:hypothetical protein [Nocardiopsaceae bacterium]
MKLLLDEMYGDKAAQAMRDLGIGAAVVAELAWRAGQTPTSLQPRSMGGYEMLGTIVLQIVLQLS